MNLSLINLLRQLNMKLDIISQHDEQLAQDIAKAFNANLDTILSPPTPTEITEKVN